MSTAVIVDAIQGAPEERPASIWDLSVREAGEMAAAIGLTLAEFTLLSS